MSFFCSTRNYWCSFMVFFCMTSFSMRFFTCTIFSVFFTCTRNYWSFCMSFFGSVRFFRSMCFFTCNYCRRLTMSFFCSASCFSMGFTCNRSCCGFCVFFCMTSFSMSFFRSMCFFTCTRYSRSCFMVFFITYWRFCVFFCSTRNFGMSFTCSYSRRFFRSMNPFTCCSCF